MKNGKQYPKEVLESERKKIMQAHENAIKVTATPLTLLILASISGAVIFALYELFR